MSLARPSMNPLSCFRSSVERMMLASGLGVPLTSTFSSRPSGSGDGDGEGVTDPDIGVSGRSVPEYGT